MIRAMQLVGFSLLGCIASFFSSWLMNLNPVGYRLGWAMIVLVAVAVVIAIMADEWAMEQLKVSEEFYVTAVKSFVLLFIVGMGLFLWL